MNRKILVLFFGFISTFISVLGNGRTSSIEATQDEIVIDSIQMVAVSNCFINTDGELHIYASSGSATLEYSLNGSAWQLSGSFTNLNGGIKSISIRDTSNISETKDTAIVMSAPSELVVEINKTDVIDTLGNVSIIASGGTGVLEYYLGLVPAPTYTATTFYPDLDTGLYYVSVRDANLCVFDTTLRIDSIVPLDINVTILNDISECHPDNGTPDGYITISFNDQTNVNTPISYYLIGRNGNNIIFENIPDFASQFYNTIPGDTFDLVVADNSLPRRYYQDTIVIQGPDPIQIGDTNIVTAGCLNIKEGETDIGEIHLTGITGGSGSYTYMWGHELNTTTDVTGVSGGTYSIRIRDNNGCVSINPIFVPYDVSKQSVAIINNMLDTSCFNMEYTLEADTSNADSYIWEKYNNSNEEWEELTSNIDKPIHTAGSWYRVVASNSYNCIDMDSLYLYMYPRFVIDIDEDKDSIFVETNESDRQISVTEDLKDNDYTLTYNWTDLLGGIDNIDNTTISETNFLVPDTHNVFIYVLTATSDLGCNETDTLTVIVEKFIRIPTAFSPNGDGINDVWNLDFSAYFKTEIIIFTRWGEVIYRQPSAFNVRWDGNINGKPAPIGTYYYVINIDNPDNPEPETGPITIVR